LGYMHRPWHEFKHTPRQNKICARGLCERHCVKSCVSINIHTTHSEKPNQIKSKKRKEKNRPIMTEARVAENDTSFFLTECLDLFYESGGAKNEVMSKKGRYRTQLFHDLDFIDYLVEIENKSDDLRDFLDETKKMLDKKKNNNNMRGFLFDKKNGKYVIDHKVSIIESLLFALKENIKYIQNIQLDDNDSEVEPGCKLCMRPPQRLRSESFEIWKCLLCSNEICLTCYSRLSSCPYCRTLY